MLDLAIVLFAARAIVTAARLRWSGGTGSAVAALAVWVLLVFAGWHGRAAGEWGIDGAWMLLLLGPSATVGPTAIYPALAAVGRHAMSARFVGASFAAIGFVSGMRHAGRHSPLTDEAVRWNGGALAFLPVLVLITGEIIVFTISALVADS